MDVGGTAAAVSLLSRDGGGRAATAGGCARLCAEPDGGTKCGGGVNVKRLGATCDVSGACGTAGIASSSVAFHLYRRSFLVPCGFSVVAGSTGARSTRGNASGATGKCCVLWKSSLSSYLSSSSVSVSDEGGGALRRDLDDTIVVQADVSSFGLEVHSDGEKSI